MNMLVISERAIRRQGQGLALAACWRQWRAERRLARRGVHFRESNIETVARAYRAMSTAEFEGINARQDWANWRTIPRALNGHVPDRPLRIVDLGCGTGSSTRVLAWYAPGGSHITGYEMAEPLLGLARGRAYRSRAGQEVATEFVCQEVTRTLQDRTGSALSDRSVDLVNASGVVGHHLGAASIAPLIKELCRVMRPLGTAMLDVGPTLGAPELHRLMTDAGFQYLGHYRCGWWDPTGEMVFRGPDA